METNDKLPKKVLLLNDEKSIVGTFELNEDTKRYLYTNKHEETIRNVELTVTKKGININYFLTGLGIFTAFMSNKKIKIYHDL